MIDAGHDVFEFEGANVGIQKEIVLPSDGARSGGIWLGVEFNNIRGGRRDAIGGNDIAGESGANPISTFETATERIEDGEDGAIVIKSLGEIAAALFSGWHGRN